MARVYEMTASFSRKVQVKQFEPAEASFEMKVELEEGDDPTVVRTYIMQEVRDAVTQAMTGRVGKGGEVKIVEKTEPAEKTAGDVLASKTVAAVPETVDEGAKPDPEPAKKARGRPPGSKNKPKEEVADVASVLDIVPAEDENLQDTNVVDLIPKEAEPELKPELTLAQLKTLMNKVTGDGVKVPKVRKLLGKYGVASTTELDPSDYPEFYELLTEIKDEELQL